MSRFYAGVIVKETDKSQSDHSRVLINSSPLFRNLARNASNPSEEDIFEFVSPFFEHAGLTPENVIIMMIYVDRMRERSKVVMAPDNWAILLLGAILITCKVWDDLSIWNADFCSIFQEITVDDMNILERFYLSLMDYNVSVKASLFAKKFFDLRDFAILTGSSFDLKALTQSDAEQLESQTKFVTKAVKHQYRDTDLGKSKKWKSENALHSEVAKNKN